MEPEKKSTAKKKGRGRKEPTLNIDDGDNGKKRSYDGYAKERDADELARQQQCTFEDFELDYALWYCACVVSSEPPLRKGVVLVHKPTYRPFVVIAELPHESRGVGDAKDPAIDDIEYVFYTDELDKSAGYIHQWMARADARRLAPVVIEGSSEMYALLGALTPQEGEDRRVALMYWLGMTMQAPNPEVVVKLKEERRVLKARRRLQSAVGGDMEVDGNDDNK
jgi:hypothetical protein